MKTVDILVKTLWNKLFSTKKSIIGFACLVLLSAGLVAQEVTYDIISTTGKIVDKKSGKELKVGDRVTMQTELQFNSLNDRAIVLNPEKTKYFLELPKESGLTNQLTVASDDALSPVKARTALSSGVRGNSVMVTDGLSSESLRKYFVIDTFTIIGSKFTLPVGKKDAQKYNLMLRYEIGNIVKEYISPDFSISQTDLKLEGNRISECFLLIMEGENTIPVLQLSLFFVDKEQLFDEFSSLLKAMNLSKKDKTKAREIIREYCTDVYGMIDGPTLDDTINKFLSSK
jgi:hypothetical protein